MIHYRISATEDNQLTPKIYRSFNSVLKDNRKIQGSIYAYSCYMDAKSSQTENRLNLKYESPFLGSVTPLEPKYLEVDDLRNFVASMREAKNINPLRCDSQKRQWYRDLYYDNIYIYGFDAYGRAISARIYFDLSSKFNRTKAPIYINNKKSNSKGLLKYIGWIY